MCQRGVIYGLFAVLLVVRKSISPWPVVFQLWIIVKKKKKKKKNMRAVSVEPYLFVLGTCLFINVINKPFFCFDVYT